MSGRDLTIPDVDGDRSVLGCRVSQSTQDRFATFVEEHIGNSRGAYGYAVEKAMEEYMDNDRYARIEDRLSNLEETAAETNALLRKLVTAEKEKGVFLEDAPGGNTAGQRKEREDSVVAELVRQCAEEDHKRVYTETEVNGVIADVAGVGSEPTKRDYRETLIERELLTQHYGKYAVTDGAVEQSGYTVRNKSEE